MTKKNGYQDWTDHPRWRELEKICNDYERLKEEAEELRLLIQKEVFG